MPKIYDPLIDDSREITQAEVDQYVRAAHCYGQLRMLLRTICKEDQLGTEQERMLKALWGVANA